METGLQKEYSYDRWILLGLFVILVGGPLQSLLGCILVDHLGYAEDALLLRGPDILLKLVGLAAAFLCVLQRPRLCLWFLGVFILLFGASAAMAPGNVYLLREFFVREINYILAPAFLLCAPSDTRRIYKTFCRAAAASLPFCLGLIFVIVVYGYGANESAGDVHGMGFAYALLLPALVYLARFFDEGKLRHLLISAFLAFCILWKGARGALLCYAAAFLLLLPDAFGRLRRSSFRRERGRFEKLYALTFVFLLCLFGGSAVLLSLVRSGGSVGVRTVDSVVEALREGKLDDSGRTQYFQTPIYEEVMEHTPLVGRGLFADRVYLHEHTVRVYIPERLEDGYARNYPHHVVLEMAYQFGALWGVLLFLALCVFIALGFCKSEWADGSRYVLIPLLGYSVCLFYSNSYLFLSQLWMLLGLCANLLTRPAPPAALPQA